MACKRETTDETVQITIVKTADQVAAKFTGGGKYKNGFLTPQSNDKV